METSLNVDFGSCSFGPIFVYPLEQVASHNLRSLLEWYATSADHEGMIDRRQITPASLGRLLNYVSLFELVGGSETPSDFEIRVISREAAEVFGEVSRKKGSQILPAPLFERWLHVYRVLLQSREPMLLRTRMRVNHKHRCAETLLLPVKKDGQLRQVMELNDYFSYDWKLYHTQDGRQFGLKEYA